MNMYIWIVIIGGSILTILSKTFPIVFISKINLNNKILNFLKLIPISILIALIVSELFIVDNKVNINLCEVLAAIPTILIAIKKNNLLLTVIVGIISVALLRIILVNY